MTSERQPTPIHRLAVAYQMLLFVDSDACASDSLEIAALGLLHDEGLIRLMVSSEQTSLPNCTIADEYEVDVDLYSFVYGLLHPELDGHIATFPATDKAMQVAKAVRHGADIFVTNDSQISHRDRPFERLTDMHLLEPAQAVELVMQEIHNAD
ncbi:MAG: hypothetical protein Q8M73_00665 [Actinomycetota bacterium]|nr:hypothetical protein [Actinomycetota bacterium]